MKKSLFLIGFVLLFFSCTGEEQDMHTFQGEALGTTYMVKYFSDKDFNFEKSMDSIIKEINASMSTYSTNSDISRINRGDSTVRVDENFVRVFKASEKIYNESNGFFDPSVGILVNAYGFGPGDQLKQLDSTVVDSLKGLVGFNKISLNADHTLSKDDPSVYLDFNAIAKGYAIDVIGNYLETENVENYLIELGGELRARGKNLDSDSEWIVGIDHPMQEAGNRELYAKLKLKNTAMATSGNYRKFRIDSVTGQKFVHTINPLSGKAEKSNLLSASVLAENCMLADGYATAFMAMGLERSREMHEKLSGVEMYLIFSNEEGGMEVFATPGFQQQLVE